MDIFTLRTISWPLVRWCGLVRITDRGRLLCSGLSCLATEPSRCYVKPRNTGSESMTARDGMDGKDCPISYSNKWWVHIPIQM